MDYNMVNYRFWLAGGTVGLEDHPNAGNYYHPLGFISAHLLAPNLSSSAGAFERQCSKERGM